MLLKLNKEDNQKFFDAFDAHNRNAEQVRDKIALDVFIEALDLIENDIVFHCVVLDKSEIKVFGAKEENIEINQNKKPGENVTVRFSDFEPEFKQICLSAVREIKISKMID
jgi:hypothetical protein